MNAEELLALAVSRSKPVLRSVTPELELWFRSMSGSERGEAVRLQDDAAGAMRHAIKCCLVNEDGSRLMTDKQIEELMRSDGRLIELIVAQAMEASGLGAESGND